MALVKISWKETMTYSAEVEIDAFDPEGDPIAQITQAIYSDSFEPDTISPPNGVKFKVVRRGEKAPEIAPRGKVYEEDF